jgi:hypothetical protein
VSGTEWTVTQGARVVDPSREPTFEILPDGKIVEVENSHPGTILLGVMRSNSTRFFFFFFRRVEKIAFVLRQKEKGVIDM